MQKRAMLFAVAMSAACGAATAQETVKMAYIDPLSGGGAVIGKVGLQHFQWLAEQINAQGGLLGRKVEILSFDNKNNPQESVMYAQKAIEAGARYITQGSGAPVAAALSEFVTKHNERNPGQEVVYFNYAAADVSLTNEKCSFWHFRWTAGSDMKMVAITNYLKGQPDVKKVYLINQDYSFGQSLNRLAREMLAAKRPDIEIVGNELHPLLKITDFSPYIAKIKASGADTIITGNWGPDMSLLLKAAADAGLSANWFTYYGGSVGGPTAIKQAGLAGKVYDIVDADANTANEAAQAAESEFRKRYGMGIWHPRAINEMWMFAKAVKEINSLDPKAVALKMEGMTSDVFGGGQGTMRKSDHQWFQDMYIRSFGPLAAGQKFDEEGTGWGWTLKSKIAAADTDVPTTCKMERP